MLVADALRLGGAILGTYSDMLAPQLVGRLLPEAPHNPAISSLLKQCVHNGKTHCALLPSHHCLHTPGGPLKVNMNVHNHYTWFSLSPLKGCNVRPRSRVIWKGVHYWGVRFTLNTTDFTVAYSREWWMKNGPVQAGEYGFIVARAVPIVQVWM